MNVCVCLWVVPLQTKTRQTGYYFSTRECGKRGRVLFRSTGIQSDLNLASPWVDTTVNAETYKDFFFKMA